MRLLSVLLLGAALAGCDVGLVGEAKDAVRATLKDPDSAKFEKVRLCEKPNAVRGDVNARNGFGAYTGSVPFYYVNGQLAMADGDERTSAKIEQFSRLCFSDDVLKQTDALMNGATLADIDKGAY